MSEPLLEEHPAGQLQPELASWEDLLKELRDADLPRPFPGMSMTSIPLMRRTGLSPD